MEILVSTSIHWGSALESMGGIVLMLDVNIYIYFISLGGGDHCSSWEVEIENNSLCKHLLG